MDMDYEIMARMIFVGVVFFWSGWQFRASRMEKQIIAVNKRFEKTIIDIEVRINQELTFSRIERDGFLRQQQEVLTSLEAYNKHYLELKKQEKEQEKEALSEAKTSLDTLRKNKK